MIHITPKLAIDENELHEEFVRSSGAGGQNVNKVSTAVQLRFDVAGSPTLPGDVKERLRRLAGKRIADDGVLIIKAQSFRTQERNRQDALNRLTAMIAAAAEKPIPRRPTKPTRSSQQRRLQGKQIRGQVKQSRRSIRDWSD